MINTLALFLSEKEQCQSRCPTSDTSFEFEPDIFLQSILMVRMTDSITFVCLQSKIA